MNKEKEDMNGLGPVDNVVDMGGLEPADNIEQSVPELPDNTLSSKEEERLKKKLEKMRKSDAFLYR